MREQFYLSGVFVSSKVGSSVRIHLFLVILLALAGCAHLRQKTNADDAAGIQALTAQLTALGPGVRKEEARDAAVCAFETSRQLAVEYRVVRPALWHNFLVNSGLRKRGLCYQWAEDLLCHLEQLDLATLELHWGVAREDTISEHNCIVITARGQFFDDGIILDPWRQSGRLVWKQVFADGFPWKEGELPPPASKAPN